MYKELRTHIIKLLNQDTRLDGRKPLEFRKPIEIKYGISKSAEGSAQVTMGDTIVLAGVKMSIMEPYPDTPEEGGLMIGAELIPLSNPDFELGPPGIQATELGRVVDRGIRESKAIDMKKLCIEAGKRVWSVSIDIIPLNDAGNLFDIAAIAAMAALKDTRLPVYEGEKIDYKHLTDQKLPLTKIPIGVTVIKIGNKFIVDPTYEEEKVVDARLSVVSTENGKLCAMQKGGDYPLNPEEINEMVEIGIEKAKELRKFL